MCTAILHLGKVENIFYLIWDSATEQPECINASIFYDIEHRKDNWPGIASDWRVSDAIFGTFRSKDFCFQMPI